MRSSSLQALTLGLALQGGCAPHDPPAPSTDAARSRADGMTLGLMYWAGDRYVLGSDADLVFGAVVEHLESRPAEHPELRGPTIVEATLRVQLPLRQLDDPHLYVRHPRLERGDRVRTDGASGLHLGDRVLVFATHYDGGFGIVPKRDTRTPIGIVVTSWSDPIVGATSRWLDDPSNWAADADIWRPYGEAALDCMRQEIPMSHCSL